VRIALGTPRGALGEPERRRQPDGRSHGRPLR
jgi:hypothetical protein